jgi:hypothetical protein
MTIKVSLKEPPTIDGEMLPVPAGETPSLVFQIDDKALALFKSTISSRGLVSVSHLAVPRQFLIQIGSFVELQCQAPLVGRS